MCVSYFSNSAAAKTEREAPKTNILLYNDYNQTLLQHCIMRLLMQNFDKTNYNKLYKLAITLSLIRSAKFCNENVMTTQVRVTK